MPLTAWRDMLSCLQESTPAAFVDWFGVERIDGRDLDCGFYRHYVDPTQPFADSLLRQAHGALVTSATLTDRDDQGGTDWLGAEIRTGALHIPNEAEQVKVASPLYVYEADGIYTEAVQQMFKSP